MGAPRLLLYNVSGCMAVLKQVRGEDYGFQVRVTNQRTPLGIDGPRLIVSPSWSVTPGDSFIVSACNHSNKTNQHIAFSKNIENSNSNLTRDGTSNATSSTYCGPLLPSKLAKLPILLFTFPTLFCAFGFIGAALVCCGLLNSCVLPFASFAFCLLFTDRAALRIRPRRLVVVLEISAAVEAPGG